jgi:hypothetical protein
VLPTWDTKPVLLSGATLGYHFAPQRWLTDPDRAPTGHQLAQGRRIVLGDLSTAGTSSMEGSPQNT